MTKRKLSEEADNLKLPDLNTFNISSEISEASDYILFVRNQQDDEKSKTLEEAWKEGKRATDKLLQLLKVKIIDGNPAVTAEPIYQSSEPHIADVESMGQSSEPHISDESQTQ